MLNGRKKVTRPGLFLCDLIREISRNVDELALGIEKAKLPAETMLTMSVSRVEDEQFRLLMKRLEGLSRLMAANVAKGLTFREQVKLLSSAGLAPKEIADILNTNANNVRVTLSAIRHPSKKKP